MPSLVLVSPFERLLRYMHLSTPLYYLICGWPDLVAARQLVQLQFALSEVFRINIYSCPLLVYF